MTNNLKSPLTSSESETCMAQSLNVIVLPDATERTSLIQELALTNTGIQTPDVTKAAAAYTTQITSPFLNAMKTVSCHSRTTALAEITNIAKSRKTSVAATQECLTIKATEHLLHTDHTSDANSPPATPMKKFCAYHMTLPPVIRRGKSVAQRLIRASPCMTSSSNTVANKTVLNSIEQFTSSLTAPALPQTNDPTEPWTTSPKPQIMSGSTHNTTSGVAPYTNLMVPPQNIPLTLSLAPYTIVQSAPQISAPSQAVYESPLTAIKTTQSPNAASLGATFMSSPVPTYLLSSSLSSMAVPTATRSEVNLVPYTTDMRTPAGMYPRSTEETHLYTSGSHFKTPTAKRRIAPKANIKTPDVDVKTPDVHRKTPDVDVKTPDVDVKTPDIGGTRKRTYSKRNTNVY
ncbi:chitinase-like protein PB1E7.04c [Biomphalaria pfeifferi]|uniref:Chitinase-like protein PB1E7.04c n=1 Tax=Biomphalaria pfeifferi TaxID=112525 RepID=A0AAD8BYT8_BIOPF|nr:chitinase-like protein PB1E7.04c [Biomphalaria pfeifferi]